MEQDQMVDTLPEPTDAEQAAADALARAHVPPSMTVGTAPTEGPGARMAAAAAAAAEELDDGDLLAEPEPVRDAMKRLANDTPTEEDMALGLDWLLSDEQEVNTRELKVRAGGSDAERRSTSRGSSERRTRTRFARPSARATARTARSGAGTNRSSPIQHRGKPAAHLHGHGARQQRPAGRAGAPQGHPRTPRCGCGSGSTTARA
jgi:hypothetical protein